MVTSDFVKKGKQMTWINNAIDMCADIIVS